MMKHNVYVRATAQMLGVFALAFLVSHPAFAAGGLSGGLSMAQTNINSLSSNAMLIAAAGAVVYLLFKAVQAWTGRCEWSEFLISCVWVAVAGASVTLAGWLWKTMA